MNVEDCADLIRERGPMTVAAFMELALYHPEFGYYARADRRSGRAGDFFTSVDAGPLFGELLERQLAEMANILIADCGARIADCGARIADCDPRPFDLVEAGAGNGRLSADILHAARTRAPAFYDSIRLHLVDVSAAACGAHRSALGEASDRLVWSNSSLPDSFEGALVANELIDALPVHQVVMREEGLREVYVVADAARLALVEGPPSTPALREYLDRLGVQLQPGWRVEINLRALEWLREAGRRLRRGFVIVIDYGHEARELYSASHSSGTLTTFCRHRSAGPEKAGPPSWLQSPGEQDITAHVDFTSLQTAAEGDGLQTLGFMDQTYFLLGLLPAEFGDAQSVRNLKTLIMPGGLGSTHKVMIFGKGVGAPALRGCSYGMRVT
jgi:SAM-dependent MidA family methyltransferase